jgi:ADP-ribose pyrophosphatase
VPSYQKKSSALNEWVTLIETSWVGNTTPYFHLKVPDYVFILAITIDGLSPLVRQYRIPISRYTLELPAGLVENNQSPIDAAIQELKEETGIHEFDNIIAMPSMILDSGRIENCSFGFVALNAVKPLDQAEMAELETLWIAPDELVSMAISGKIDHMGQVALILWAERAGYLRK